jgi:hypothetical protein
MHPEEKYVICRETKITVEWKLAVRSTIYEIQWRISLNNKKKKICLPRIHYPEKMYISRSEGKTKIFLDICGS